MINNLNKLENYIQKFNLEEVFPPEIRRFLKIKKYAKGEIIFNAYKPVLYIYFLVEGLVEINSIMLSGNKLFINNLFPLELIGDLEYMNNQDAMFDVVAADASTAILLPFDIAKKYLEDNPKFWRLLAIECNKKLLRTNKAIILKGSYSLKTVLANYLIKNNYEITFSSLVDLAAHLNVSYRNLSRVIKTLSEEGVIKKDRKKIITLKRKELKNYSVNI
ncbi:Crp/Fnr family transcriptional regulator [uncultured Ilyobacter sp.]|uniref:Crp/Fnr family transcriptional regulator n=1 Tax=uncultured Ilyobacter sp. TaxID=544433 RepID=UPI0029C64EAD|nr:Crp/Fnr family transcriptional regulator [uncultured Ilyobacter sp.]